MPEHLDPCRLVQAVCEALNADDLDAAAARCAPSLQLGAPVLVPVPPGELGPPRDLREWWTAQRRAGLTDLRVIDCRAEGSEVVAELWVSSHSGRAGMARRIPLRWRLRAGTVTGLEVLPDAERSGPG